MSGSGQEGEKVTSPKSPQRGVGVRSASPAKRSAADMEGEEQKVPGAFRQEEGKQTSTDFDEAMAGMTPSVSGDGETQTSGQESMVTDTAATSLQSEELPPYSESDNTGSKTSSAPPSIDEQERIVRELSQGGLDEGQRGYVVSTKWLSRVLSRSSEGINNPAYPKEAREGDIGPIDNSDVVPEGSFEAPIRDAANKDYIPLKPGLSIGEDYELLPEKAWGQVLTWYGLAKGQKQIVRYAHNTAPAEATMPNFMYELWPPVFAIRKVPQASQEARPSSSRSLDELRKRQEQRNRGQLSPDDAFRLVSSRSEKFQNFLKRAKEAAEIPFSTKVKIWRTDKASTAPAKGNSSGVLSPPESRSTSPKAEQPPKLVIDADTFNKMEECQPVDGKDETGNANYNGSSTMDMYGLFEDTTLVLEEQIGGPAGGEFASDNKPKHTIKLGLPGRSTGSKAPSAAPSRGASPAPGMMTRGRQRRDGRTRGTVGLSNLGNTCYMNSALQCIRSVEELAFYFLSDKYKSEINTANPLGHGGVMAKQYANLVSAIYSDNASGSFTPSQFKKTVGSLQPLFSGYGQQDSQEFLSFLVDAIHEDLNRIIKKPYNENPDSDDNTVKDPQAIIELGETYRANHKARNESIAMDLFNGFYKNTMECPDCGKISITFDPYSLVTVQLPIESTFTHKYTFIPLSGEPVNHDIDIDKMATIKTLKEYIASKHPGVSADRLWMVEVYSHKIYKVFENTLTLAEAGIGNNDYIFLFELTDAPSNAPVQSKAKKYTLWNSSSKGEEAPEMDDPKADQFSVPVFSRQKNRHGNGWEMILHPTYIVVSREEAKDYQTILKKVLVAISRLTSMPILTDLDENLVQGEQSSDDSTETGTSLTDDKEVSDRSASDEDYVHISKHADGNTQANGEAMQANGVESTKGGRHVPQGFVDPQYHLSAALRNHLFLMKYAKGAENMHVTGLNGFNDKAVAQMSDRVKQPSRRGSTDSTGTDDAESTTSTASGAPENGEAEVEDSDPEFDKPDIVVGEQSEDALGLPTTAANGSDSGELPDDPLEQKPGRGRRGQKQHRGKNKRGRRQQVYGKKSNKEKKKTTGNVGFNLGGKPKEDEEDNPYFIKLGEGIVLDWYPEALGHLFAGNASDEDDKRGHFTSHHEGKNLEVFHDAAIEEKRAKRSLRKKQGVSLEECFLETGKREVLSEDNAWYCGRCKELRRATKTLEIWTIPDILVVHLKRFGGNRSFRDKIDVLVDFPIEGLDMTDRVGLKEEGKEYVYDLFAVDNHFGGLGGGHYTAHAKNFYDGQWYDYNDTMCSRLNDRSLKNNAAAYLLFYRRRSPTPLGPEYLQKLVNEARNPIAAPDAPTDDDPAVEESDSGEGRLGGPTNGSLRSSGGWNGAGAGASSAAGNGGTSGARQGADSSLMTKMGTSDDDDGGDKVFYGPQKPPHLREFRDEESGWGFGGLDRGGGDTGSDADSTHANIDHDSDGDQLMANSVMLDDSPPDLEAAQDPFISPADAGTPMDYEDDHDLYSTGRNDAYDDFDNDDRDVLHLEEAGNMGADAESPSTAEVDMRSPDREDAREGRKQD